MIKYVKENTQTMGPLTEFFEEPSFWGYEALAINIEVILVNYSRYLLKREQLRRMCHIICAVCHFGLELLLVMITLV